MSLERFGEKLRQLRKQTGLTQLALAKQVPVSTELISIWERAYQHQGRSWQPDRDAVVRLATIFADHLDPVQAQRWAADAGYQLGQTELQQIFPGYAPRPSAFSFPQVETQANLKRLTLPPAQRLFGVNRAQEQLQTVLVNNEGPWLVVIDGIGGIGKTSLAAALVREFMATEHFHDVAWVSAKQEEFLPGTGLRPVDRPALDADTLVDTLLEQLDGGVPLTYGYDQKIAILSGLLDERAYLLVIDNLETMVDYEILLPLLRKLASPSKFLLTSRHDLQVHPDVFCLRLRELNQSDTLALLRYEAEMRGLSAVVRASSEALVSIYEIVGGNPLALKLVVGQIGRLPLAQVLENLKGARGRKIDELYTYIYWQAWQDLDPVSREVLLVMPLVQGGSFAHLSALTQLELDTLNQALEYLITLSLVEVSGDIEQRRYRIHRLTETFLLNEVAKWQSPEE